MKALMKLFYNLTHLYFAPGILVPVMVLGSKAFRSVRLRSSVLSHLSH